jgi:hypothetical protein
MVVLVVALPVLTYPLGRDQGEFAVIARGVLTGQAPYRDLWNPKPPAVFFVYAAAMTLLGQTAAALRAIDFVIVAGVMACLWWIARKILALTPHPSPERGVPLGEGSQTRHDKVGLVAALLFGVFYFSETFWTLTQNDGIAILPMCLALVCALKAGEGTRRAWLWALAAGAWMGVVFWFKYPFAAFGVVVVVFYACHSKWQASPSKVSKDTPQNVENVSKVSLDTFQYPLASRFERLATKRRYAVSLLAFALGGILVLAAGAAWLVSIGAWEAFLESIRVTAGYTALGADAAALGEAASIALSTRWAQWGLLFILATIGAWALRRSPARWLLWTWLGATFTMMLVQLRGYDYHWLPMLPPLAMFGGAGLAWIMQRTQHAVSVQSRGLRTWHAVSLLLALLALSIYPHVLPYVAGRENQISYYDRFVAGEFVAGESQRVADWLSARVQRGDSLYIWGFRPEIYYLTGLNPPTRFIFQFPLVADWYPALWRQENVDVLWAALPPYVLVAQVDYMPWVTGSEDDSNTLLQSYTELNDWLIYNYERETQIGNLFLWRRKS